MRLRAIAGSAALLLLAACGGGTEANNVAEADANATREAGTSDAQNKVRALDEGQRNGVLIRAIRDAGLECQHVEASELTATSNNLPVYMATCGDGAVYAVAIRDDGSATVRAVTPAEGK